MFSWISRHYKKFVTGIIFLLFLCHGYFEKYSITRIREFFIDFNPINIYANTPYFMKNLNTEKTPEDAPLGFSRETIYTAYQSCGPAATSALPASLPSYFLKFLMNLAARSFAFSSHSAASA